MGWSSWYAFGPTVSQEKLEATYLRLTDRNLIPGLNRSLRDAGYVFANVDDGWQACHAGANGSFHSADGWPLLDKEKFPDVGAMTQKARDAGLKPGFYFNNYICGEGVPYGGVGGAAYLRNMRGNVAFLAKHGFGYVKVDSGGVYNDLDLWHRLLSEAGRDDMVLENCHQGHLEPNASWCPYSLFRTSGDLHVVGLDVELMATANALKLSRPGCWAYPDTLDPGSEAAVRSQFSAYAAMSAPLVLSFDVLKDEKLLPIFGLLTNEEVIAVNQRWAGSPGRLVQKWAPHGSSEPLFPWLEACNESEPLQAGWELANSTVRWKGGGEELCLAAGSGPLGLQPCDGSRSQHWRLAEGRLWQAATADLELWQEGPGSLRAEPCNASEPGQHWRLSVPPGNGTACNVQNHLPWMAGGCWEITGCSTAPHAEVGVNFGCKAVPPKNFSDPCLANGAWAFHGNGTVTSVMDGHCLSVDADRSVDVSPCDGSPSQRWHVLNESITTADGLCIGSGVPAPPPGSDGRCVAAQRTDDAGGAGAWHGTLGPAMQLAPAEACTGKVSKAQALEIQDGRLRAAGMCAAAHRGAPTPFGPLQLWAKAQPAGAVALALLNRASRGGAAANVTLQLSELKELGGRKKVKVRDLWARRDLAPAEGSLELEAPAGDARMLLLTPEDGQLAFF